MVEIFTLLGSFLTVVFAVWQHLLPFRLWFIFGVILGNSAVFPSIKGRSEAELEQLYNDYAKSFGDCEAPKDVSAKHGSWELVGHGEVTNSYCGGFKKLKICPRAELHAQSNLDGVSHAREVFVHKVHFSCNNPRCPICVFSGWARREADHIAQRTEFGSKRFGASQHIVVSPPSSDWGLAEFHNGEFRVKVKKILSEVGVQGGVLIFHPFRYASYQESIEKGVLFGWYWSPHAHSLAFILGGYGKCRSCTKTLRRFRVRSGRLIEQHGSELYCSGCDGFEHRVRESYKKYGYIIKVQAERATVYGTAWYQLNHSGINAGVSH